MKMVDHYRNSPQGEWKLEGRYVQIAEKIRKDVEPQKKVLDVGAGDGRIANRLAEYNPVTCMEINKNLVKRLKNKGYRVIEQDIEKEWKSKTNYFDVVIMSEVLEHCFDTMHILSESYRVLKKKGKVIITTPNITSIGHRMQILLGREPSYYSHTSFEHIRIFTPTSMKIMMEKSGFVNVKTRTMVGVPVRNFGEIIYATGEKK